MSALRFDLPLKVRDQLPTSPHKKVVMITEKERLSLKIKEIKVKMESLEEQATESLDEWIDRHKRRAKLNSDLYYLKRRLAVLRSSNLIYI